MRHPGGQRSLTYCIRLLQKSTVSQSCLQDCPDFAERMKRKALRVRSEGSIPPYVTEAESRKQHSDSPLCNSLCRNPREVIPAPIRVISGYSSYSANRLSECIRGYRHPSELI